MPTLPLGKARVHAEQIAREQRGFIATGARANFEEDIALIRRIFGKERECQFFLDALDIGLRGVDLFLRHVAHFRVSEHFLRADSIGLTRLKLRKQRRDRLDVASLPRQRAVAIHVVGHRGIRQQALHLHQPARELFKLDAKSVFHGSLQIEKPRATLLHPKKDDDSRWTWLKVHLPLF